MPRYTIYSDGYYHTDYEVEEIPSIYEEIWNDSVGSCFIKPVNSDISEFNRQYFEVWESIKPLLDIDENEIKYESREGEINGLQLE